MTVPTYRVALERTDGPTETLSVAADETVLAAAERADDRRADGTIGLPFGCLRGACGTCTGQVLAGAVEHRRPPRALKECHLAEGYALLCIAEPRSDCHVRAGNDVRAELVENPWK